MRACVVPAEQQCPSCSIAFSKLGDKFIRSFINWHHIIFLSIDSMGVIIFPVSAPDIQEELYIWSQKSSRALLSYLYRPSDLCHHYVRYALRNILKVWSSLSFLWCVYHLSVFWIAITYPSFLLPINISPFLKFFLTAVHIVTFYSGCPYTSAKTNIWPKRRV